MNGSVFLRWVIERYALEAALKDLEVRFTAFTKGGKALYINSEEFVKYEPIIKRIYFVELWDERELVKSINV